MSPSSLPSLRRLAGLALLALLSLAHPAISAAQPAPVTMGRPSPPAVVSGPMLGYQSHREVLVWIETSGPVIPTLDWQDESDAATRGTTIPARSIETPLGNTVHHFVVGPLPMGRSFASRIHLPGAAAANPPPFRFRTTSQWEWRTDPPAFSFLAGSCAYLNDEPYDRPGRPYGQGTSIFRTMAASGADFMLWLGDNLYFREADYSSRAGLWYRWSKDRSTHDLQPLLVAMPHYGIWDDHDFGPNDSGRSFPLKADALEAFRAYYPNPSAGEPGHPGIYTQFRWGDADFFLLDNRMFRDDATASPATTPGKQMLGDEQLRWLEQALIVSQQNRNTSFRFIAVGSQVLNPIAVFENYSNYPEERARLLRFIRTQRIEGVVFLTGDRHHSELITIPGENGAPPLYDVTTSPLSSGVASGPGRREQWNEWENPARVPGTLLAENSYARLAISGPRNGRILTVSAHAVDGTARWTREIPAASLQYPRN